MKFILGKKISMSQVFLPNGESVAVTRVQAGPCPIVQVKAKGQGNNTAVQIGYDERRAFRMKKPQAGHLKDLPSLAELQDFSVEKTDGLTRGDLVTVDTFAVGDFVNVVGTSKGKGFAGVVKRHHFKGAPKSHGHKHDLRAPGSIGAGGVQRVFKGMRMAGRMGGERVTVKNLEVIAINPTENELVIKGAVPGARGSIVSITAPGDLKVQKSAAPVAAPVEAAATEPAPVEEKATA
jgi:large subunit ribosomal protein L3